MATREEINTCYSFHIKSKTKYSSPSQSRRKGTIKEHRWPSSLSVLTSLTTNLGHNIWEHFLRPQNQIHTHWVGSNLDSNHALSLRQQSQELLSPHVSPHHSFSLPALLTSPLSQWHALFFSPSFNSQVVNEFFLSYSWMLLEFRITKAPDTDMKATFPVLGTMYKGGLLILNNASINTQLWVRPELSKP